MSIALEKTQLEKIIFQILTEVCFDQDFTKINKSIPLKNQINFDSMDFLDTVMIFRERFSIDIPEEDFPKLVSIESFISYLENRL